MPDFSLASIILGDFWIATPRSRSDGGRNLREEHEHEFEQFDIWRFARNQENLLFDLKEACPQPDTTDACARPSDFLERTCIS